MNSGENPPTVDCSVMVTESSGPMPLPVLVGRQGRQVQASREVQEAAAEWAEQKPNKKAGVAAGFRRLLRLVHRFLHRCRAA
jgi:hypothetical protein